MLSLFLAAPDRISDVADGRGAADRLTHLGNSTETSQVEFYAVRDEVYHLRTVIQGACPRGPLPRGLDSFPGDVPQRDRS